ncbi:PaeR7I family type II restriction endonuclease [Vibrio comitans]|uniref:Type II restriction endonuclease n=1 Tax=Vibrio comitans NBRC 102076 TaxID=1219078 RepID=A0A4Y3IL19_9VIBR|nr:PaeR7I family type II restriction endonuclease [Vibrio comitans]GEA59608.1 hypothetical protein VCO01S_08010 [Vibrio comitans NBRC 102076]
MESRIQEAVNYFWHKRETDGVRSGQTLDGFTALLEEVIIASGLQDIEVFTSKKYTQLPGFYRPHKSWDVVVTVQNQLLAAIELKSQVGSVGKNYNNRTEEVLGSGIDLFEATQEGAFEQEIDVFKGYIILVGDCQEANKTPKIDMPLFPVMDGFLLNESERLYYSPDVNGVYPESKGISYIYRYDQLCKRMMFKHMYNAASIIVSGGQGHWRSVSNKTDIRAFLEKLMSHCERQINNLHGW